MENMKQKQQITDKSHSLFLLVSCPCFLSFPTLSPLLLPSFPPSLVAFFLIWFVSFLPSFLPSFLHSFLHFFIPPSSSFHLFDSLVNFDQPLPAMRGSQTTMDTVRQHLLPRAPPGCSRACAWQAKWSSDTHGGGWISRTPMANRSWGSVETWNERNVGGFGVSLDLKLWCLKKCARKQNVTC